MKKSLMAIAAMASCSGIIASSASSCRHYPDAFAPSRGLNAENDGAGADGGGQQEQQTNDASVQQQGLTNDGEQQQQAQAWANPAAQAGTDGNTASATEVQQAGLMSVRGKVRRYILY